MIHHITKRAPARTVPHMATATWTASRTQNQHYGSVGTFIAHISQLARIDLKSMRARRGRSEETVSFSAPCCLGNAEKRAAPPRAGGAARFSYSRGQRRGHRIPPQTY